MFLLSAPGDRARELAAREQAQFIPIPMEREISAQADLRSLRELKRVLSDLAPDLVNAGTPKAGLLVTAAAAAARVPVRVLTLRGLRSATMAGAGKYLVRAAEATSCRLAHRVICISQSLCDEAIRLGVLPAARGVVLGAGSSNGVDVEHFQRTPASIAAGEALRQQLGIRPGAVVVTFVGRIHQEKGVFDLLRAFAQLDIPDAALVVAGPNELPRSELDTLESFTRDDRIKLTGHIEDVRALYATSDVVVLPSWREGFGNVVIEASAMGLPVVAADVTGCRDSVADGETGTLVPPRQPDALARALRAYVLDSSLRQQHGEAGRRRAVSLFSNQAVWSAQVAFYNELLRELPVRRLLPP